MDHCKVWPSYSCYWELLHFRLRIFVSHVCALLVFLIIK